MNLSFPDQIRVIMRFLLPIIALTLMVSAWGCWWFLWWFLITAASAGLAIYFRKTHSRNNSNNAVSALVIPQGVLCAISMFPITMKLSTIYPSIFGHFPLPAIVLTIIWMATAFFTATKLEQ